MELGKRSIDAGTEDHFSSFELNILELHPLIIKYGTLLVKAAT
jgi:hypothetical protein